jgi:thymidylate synthase ThyX
MMIDSQLILTSKNRETGVNLYTFVLQYPRVILAEVNTHRMLSRNTASSRAIPAVKQRSRVQAVPFIPITIGKNQKGMQAGQELEGWRYAVALNTWKLARYPMLLASWILEKVGAHKQMVNRIIEPWTWTQQIVTCTDLRNVFKLRNHPDAEPHFHALAAIMERQVEYVHRLFDTVNFDSRYPDGTPCALNPVNPTIGVLKVQMLKPGEWHMPFISDMDRGYPDDLLKNISVARCARVSYYLPENGKRSDPQRDMELCGRLLASGHWSPFEHVATPVVENTYIGNFRSWKQYRKEYPDEHGGDR